MLYAAQLTPAPSPVLASAAAAAPTLSSSQPQCGMAPKPYFGGESPPWLCRHHGGVGPAEEPPWDAPEPARCSTVAVRTAAPACCLLRWHQPLPPRPVGLGWWSCCCPHTARPLLPTLQPPAPPCCPRSPGAAAPNAGPGQPRPAAGRPGSHSPRCRRRSGGGAPPAPCENQEPDTAGVISICVIMIMPGTWCSRCG